MHPRYRDWIRFVFDHPVTTPQWHFEWNAPDFEVDPEDAAALVTETFENAGRDLGGYSDAQVDQGLWFLASSSGSGHIGELRDGNIPTEQKVRGIRSVYALYRDCFARRCTETLSHRDEPDSSELNSICYMFWDICPLDYLEKPAENMVLEDAIFEVLQKTLAIPHRACIEGALHGLGEVSCWSPERSRRVIDLFLSTARIDDALRSYAERARDGNIQ